jgi:hypothetical protein
VLAYCALLYGFASLVHFTHNAEFLADYPNLPRWLTRPQVYISWFCIAATGLFGYWLYRSGKRWTGLGVLAVYAAVGLDGLLHYGRAPLTAHTAIMNTTIWFEVICAVALLIMIGRIVVERVASHSG